MSTPERNNVSMRQKIMLADLVRAEYTSSGKNDGQFAELASERLGFTVTANQVVYMRDSLEIPNNLTAQREARPVTLEDAVERLVKAEQQIAELLADRQALRLELAAVRNLAQEAGRRFIGESRGEDWPTKLGEITCSASSPIGAASAAGPAQLQLGGAAN